MPQKNINILVFKSFLITGFVLVFVIVFNFAGDFLNYFSINNSNIAYNSVVFAKDYFPHNMEVKKSRFKFRRYKSYVTPTPTPIPSFIPTPSPSILPEINNININWGAFVGWEPKDVVQFESMVDKKMDYVSLFVPWGDSNNFPYEMAEYALRNNKTLVIYWEARDEDSTNLTDTKYGYDSILNGSWDSYINAFATHTKAAGTNIILIPFEEANGDWYPWSGTLNDNTAEKHNEAYIYLRNKFRDIDNVKFGLALNNVSIPDTEENSIEKYYPGAEFVDYVGVDGFNFDEPQEDFATIFEPAIIKLEKFNKPIIIFSTATPESEIKPDWILQIPSVLLKHPSVIGFSWFNENKERDWRVWSSTQSLNAFKNILK